MATTTTTSPPALRSSTTLTATQVEIEYQASVEESSLARAAQATRRLVKVVVFAGGHAFTFRREPTCPSNDLLVDADYLTPGMTWTECVRRLSFAEDLSDRALAALSAADGSGMVPEAASTLNELATVQQQFKQLAAFVGEVMEVAVLDRPLPREAILVAMEKAGLLVLHRASVSATTGEWVRRLTPLGKECVAQAQRRDAEQEAGR